MALKKPTNTPAFETEDQAEVIEAAAETANPETQVASPAAKVEATTAIAKAQTSAVGAVKKGFSAALTHLEGQFDIEMVRSLGVGTLPKAVADRAGFELGEGKDKKEFGDFIVVHIISYNSRYLATSGVDGEEGTKLLRTSYDGINVEDENITLKEYIQHLKEQGYEDAKERHYVDIFCMIKDSDKLGPVAEDEVELIQLQLSPASVKQWKAFQLKSGVTASLTGKQPTDLVKATIERKEFNSNKYAQIAFSAG